MVFVIRTCITSDCRRLIEGGGGIMQAMRRKRDAQWEFKGRGLTQIDLIKTHLMGGVVGGLWNEVVNDMI